MLRSAYNSFAVNDGIPVADAAVYVYDNVKNEPAILYANRTGGVLKTNPFNVDLTGRINFYTTPGRYRIEVALPFPNQSIVTIFDDVLITDEPVLPIAGRTGKLNGYNSEGDVIPVTIGANLTLTPEGVLNAASSASVNHPPLPLGETATILQEYSGKTLIATSMNLKSWSIEHTGVPSGNYWDIVNDTPTNIVIVADSVNVITPVNIIPPYTTARIACTGVNVPDGKNLYRVMELTAAPNSILGNFGDVQRIPQSIEIGKTLTITDGTLDTTHGEIQDLQGNDLADIAFIEVDLENRPVRFFLKDGRYYQAIEGRLSNMFGGPDAGRAVPLLDDWADLTVDSLGRPVRGTKLNGENYIAIQGILKQVVNNAVQIFPISFSAYGDSTTYGDDLDDEKGDGWEIYRWTSILESFFSVPFNNRGVNGQRIEQIGARTTGITARGTVTGGVIPASGSVTITSILPGDFAGPNGFQLLVDVMADNGEVIRGTITYSSSVHTFVRSVDGAAINTAKIDIISILGRSDMENHVFIGAGINNESRIVAGTQTISQIKAWYKSITSRCNAGYTVWGVLDRGLTEGVGTPIGDYIRELEAWLSENYGDNFINVRAYLASQQALDDAIMLEPTYSPTTNDINAVVGGTIPPSFRSSNGSVHLRARGHALQARYLARYLQRRFNNYTTN